MAEDHNPQVATQVHDGLITLRLTATDSGEAAARARLDEAEKQVSRSHLETPSSAPMRRPRFRPPSPRSSSEPG